MITIKQIRADGLEQQILDQAKRIAEEWPIDNRNFTQAFDYACEELGAFFMAHYPDEIPDIYAINQKSLVTGKIIQDYTDTFIDAWDDAYTEGDNRSLCHPRRPICPACGGCEECQCACLLKSPVAWKLQVGMIIKNGGHGEYYRVKGIREEDEMVVIDAFTINSYGQDGPPNHTYKVARRRRMMLIVPGRTDTNA